MLKKYYACAVLGLLSVAAYAEPKQEALFNMATQQQPGFIATLEDLVNIESNSTDSDGLNKINEYVIQRLRKLGGRVWVLESQDVYKVGDNEPAKLGKVVQATFTGTGTGKVLLLAHMDTRFANGMLANQPFRKDEHNIYGLGIADNKQGIATVLHTLSLLNNAGYRDYGQITVMFASDAELGAPASRVLLTAAGKSHDATFSYEASRVESDKISLATAGAATAILQVESGASAPAANADANNTNALYELTNLINQTKDLSDVDDGLKLNWTTASAGSASNLIPNVATATADIRVLRASDFDAIEKKLQERIQNNRLSQDSKVSLELNRRYAPLEAKASSTDLAQVAQEIYKDELGKVLTVDDQASGGGISVAGFAGVDSSAPVLGRMGIQGFGMHSSSDEYVATSSIVPRLYLSARMIMAVGQGRIQPTAPAAPQTPAQQQ